MAPRISTLTRIMNGVPKGPRRTRDALPGAEALVELLAFANRAADACPDIARVALLGWASKPQPGFPLAFVLRDSVADLEHQRAVRNLVQAAAIPTLEAGFEVVFYIVPAGRPQAADGVTLWPPVVAEAANGSR